jgi:hypothetical protein
MARRRREWGSLEVSRGCFFVPYRCVPRTRAAIRARGKPASPCSAQNPMPAALYTLLRSAPSRTNVPTEWTDKLIGWSSRRIFCEDGSDFDECFVLRCGARECGTSRKSGLEARSSMRVARRTNSSSHGAFGGARHLGYFQQQKLIHGVRTASLASLRWKQS